LIPFTLWVLREDDICFRGKKEKQILFHAKNYENAQIKWLEIQRILFQKLTLSYEFANSVQKTPHRRLQTSISREKTTEIAPTSCIRRDDHAFGGA